MDTSSVVRALTKPTGSVLIYVIRHGATVYNKENNKDRIRGWADIPLSPEGRTEAEKLAKKLANSGIKLLYHSDLNRAVDTAKAIAATTGATLIETQGLRPWNVGKFQGVESNKAHPELEKAASETPDTPIPGGESFNTFKNRVLDTLKPILERAKTTPTGIVTHHRVERLLNAWKAAGEPEDRSIKLAVMFTKGEHTASAEKMRLNPDKLVSHKKSILYSKKESW